MRRKIVAAQLSALEHWCWPIYVPGKPPIATCGRHYGQQPVLRGPA